MTWANEHGGATTPVPPKIVYGCQEEGHPKEYTHTHPWEAPEKPLTRQEKHAAECLVCQAMKRTDNHERR